MGIIHSQRMGDDAETDIVPVIAGDLHTARNMRLRLRFHEHELVLEERHLSLTVGRGGDNDLVMKGHLI